MLFNPLLDRVLGVTQLAHQPDKTHGPRSWVSW